jgi:hypothetical protein
MIFMSNFNKKSYIPVNFVAKPKYLVVFASRYAEKIPVLFYVDFCMNLYFVYSDEVMNC